MPDDQAVTEALLAHRRERPGPSTRFVALVYDDLRRLRIASPDGSSREAR